MVFTPRSTYQPPAVSVSFKRRFISFLIMVSLVTGVGVYITLTNGVSTQGYEIEKLNETLQALKFTNERLAAQAAKLQAVKTLEDGIIPEGYVAVQRVEYLAAIPQVGVAVK